MERFERHQKLIGKCGFDRVLAELADPQIVAAPRALHASRQRRWSALALLTNVTALANDHFAAQQRKYNGRRSTSHLAKGRSDRDLKFEWRP